MIPCTPAGEGCVMLFTAETERNCRVKITLESCKQNIVFSVNFILLLQSSINKDNKSSSFATKKSKLVKEHKQFSELQINNKLFCRFLSLQNFWNFPFFTVCLVIQ
jgi:hypothetical protein